MSSPFPLKFLGRRVHSSLPPLSGWHDHLLDIINLSRLVGYFWTNALEFLKSEDRVLLSRLSLTLTGKWEPKAAEMFGFTEVACVRMCPPVSSRVCLHMEFLTTIWDLWYRVYSKCLSRAYFLLSIWNPQNSNAKICLNKIENIEMLT